MPLICTPKTTPLPQNNSREIDQNTQLFLHYNMEKKVDGPSLQYGKKWMVQ